MSSSSAVHFAAKRKFVGSVALVGLLAALACGASAATAVPPRPANLRVTDGDGWHAHPNFPLDWTTPPASSPALATTHYRIRDPHGIAIGGGVRYGTEDGAFVAVPAVPGSYEVELWFEDASGAQGPLATAQLRFDDVRPGAPAASSVPGWIGRSSFPERIRLGHPSGPQPLSGIRGYAVSIDGSPGGLPCAAAVSCRDDETTLRGGVGADELTIASLPEGTRYLHVVAVSGSGMKSATAAQAPIRVDLTDPVTQLAGAPAGWTNRPVTLTARASDGESGMDPASAPGRTPFTAIRVDGGTPQSSPGSTVTASVLAEGVHRIAYYARDAAGNADDGAVANGVLDRAPHTTLVQIDRSPPTIAFANSQDPRDPELLRAQVGDTLSGVDASRGWIGLRPLGSRQRFAPLPAAPGAAGELCARWDSDAYPAGRYEFKAIAYDAAGNAAVTTKRRNGTPMVLSDPLKSPTRLEASFAGDRLRKMVPGGDRIRISGLLVSGIRTPLAGMTVRIVERFAAGAEPAVRVSSATTGPDGSYARRLEPGPSREVTVLFVGTQRFARASAGSLSLAVRSDVRLRASSRSVEIGGAPLVFRGLVAPAKAIPVGGLPVQLQFRLPGLPWSEFRTVQTNPRGRFRYAYRFSDDDSRGARFQFRAYVATNEDWPYEPNGSRPVLVNGY